MSQMPPPPNSPADPLLTTPPPPRKKRRRWPWILLFLFICVLLGIALLPTIISTSPVRGIVVSQVNKQINGTVEIDDWSIGWTSGVRVSGVKVFDAQKAQILQLKEFSTGLSLIGAARGNIDLGKTTIDGLNFDAKIDETGQSNFQKLLKTDGSSAPPASPKTPTDNASPPTSPSKLPNVKGDIVLSNVSGTIERAGTPAAVQITSLNGGATIADINQPITDTLDVQLKVGDASAGSLSMKGSAGAIKGNALDLNSANLNQTITMAGINLAALAPLLPPSVGINSLTGTTDGVYKLDVVDGKSAQLTGHQKGQGIAIAGPVLKGDTYRTQSFTVDVPPVVVTMPNGPMDATAFAIKIGIATPASIQPGAPGDVIAIAWDQGSIAISADAALATLQNLAANKPAGGNGSLNADVNIDLGKIAQQLPHALPLKQGTSITSGNFAQTVQVTIVPTGATFALTTDLKNIAGQNDGTAVTLQPIHASVNAKLGGSTAPARKLPDVHDIIATLTSGFATANLSAPTLAQINGDAKARLADAQSQLGQFIDFGKLKMAGDLDASIKTTADPSDLTKPALVHGTATLTNLNVTGVAEQPINEPRIVGTIDASLDTAGGTDLVSAKDVKATAQVGLAEHPSVDVLATATAILKPTLSVDYSLQKATIDSQQLQKEFGSLFIKNGRTLDIQTITAALAGKVTQANGQMQIAIATLSATESKGLFAVTQDAGGIAVMLPKTDPTAKNKAAPQASGKVHITADLVRASQIAQAFQATTQPAGSTATPRNALTSGKLDGTVALSSDATAINIASDFSATALAVNSGGGSTAPQTITFGLKASPLADFSSIKNVSLYMKGFIDASLDATAIDLPAAPVGAKGPALPIVQNAKWTLNVEDVGPLNTLAGAFLPPSDPKNPRIEVPRGSLKIAGGISHEGTATVFTVSDLSANELRLQSGANIYKVKPIQMQLTARADITGDTSQPLAAQLKQVAITQLVGHLGIAELTMPQPITIDQPLAAMHATGQIGLSGEIADATTLLETLAGKKAGELYPISGKYTLAENLSTSGNAVNVKGTIDVANFIVTQDGKQAVNEPKVSITNDLGADLVASNATINSITLDMPSSGALKANITGGVTDWVTQRKLSNVAIKYSGDWAKLWAIARPLVPAADQQMVADLAITGQFDRTINVTGSYPAGQPMNVAIKQLTADGSANIAGVSWPSMGLTASNIDLPFMLKDGFASILYAGKPAGQNAAPPMAVNNGTVDLSGIKVDLTQPDPRLTTPQNYVIAKNIVLNGVLAAQLGKFLPLFNGADNASGFLNVTFVSCDRLPVSGLVMKTGPANDGTATINYSIDKLQISSALTSAFAAAGVNANSLQGDVKDGSLSLQGGHAQQKMTLTLGEQDRPIQFGGGVNLSNETFENYVVSVPPALLKQISKDVIKYLPPEGVPFALTGPLSKPQVDGKAEGKLIADAVKKAAVDALLGKKSDNGNAASQPTKQTPEDTLGGLIDAFGKKKKKK